MSLRLNVSIRDSPMYSAGKFRATSLLRDKLPISMRRESYKEVVFTRSPSLGI